MIVASGAVALVASFLPWIKVGPFSASAWDDFFPLLTWVGIFGALMATHVALTVFASLSLPERILDFTIKQVHLVLALFAVLITVSWLIAGDNPGIGFWLSLLASIGLLVGATMLTDDDLTPKAKAAGNNSGAPPAMPPQAPPTAPPQAPPGPGPASGGPEDPNQPPPAG